MSRPTLPALLAVLALLASAVGVTACRSGSTSGDTGAEISIPAMDPDCAAYLRAMCDTITRSPAKRLKILDTWDEPDAYGQKVQLSHVREFVIAGPDRMAGRTHGDTLQRHFWKDGQTISMNTSMVMFGASFNLGGNQAEESEE